MKQKVLMLGLVFLSVLQVMPAFSNYRVVNGQKDFYFGHISWCEIKGDAKDPVVLREGQTRPEVALLNLPLGPGDTIRTSDSRRCEIQFDNGTIVRLDLDSELKIETILAQSLSTAKKVSNLLLQKGQIWVMYNRNDSMELFQIMTSSVAIKLDHSAVALIKLTEDGNADIQVERGKLSLLYGADQLHLAQTKIEQKQRFIVSGNNQARSAEYVPLSDFIAWNKSVNKDFKALHEGSFLPKPIQKLPPAVFYFAQNYGNMYGEWVWHDLYGYVWRPFYNDNYPWGKWMPYVYGNWASYQDQMFWIPGEPWGWVPYHLGIWMWDTNKGWLWLPGSAFAPAWATWDFYYGYYFWRPWNLFDWYYDSIFLSEFYYSEYQYGYYQPGPGKPPATPPENVLTHIRKDQLKKKGASPLPLPKEMKGAYNRTIAALKKGDERVLASLRDIPRQTSIIKRSDLASPKMQEKIISFEQFSKQRESLPLSERMAPSQKPQNVTQDALRNIQRSRIVSELRARVAPSPNKHIEPAPAAPLRDNRSTQGQVNLPSRIEAPKSLEKVEMISTPLPPPYLGQSLFRFRDWNPDVKMALRLGVEIFYSSRNNEIRCPQLGLSSRDRAMNPGVSMTEHGVSNSSGSGNSSSGSSSAAARSGTHSSGASGSREPSGGGGGKVKN